MKSSFENDSKIEVLRAPLIAKRCGKKRGEFKNEKFVLRTIGDGKCPYLASYFF